MDTTIEYGRIYDESRLTRTGDVVHEKVVQFWIGKHGPFVERFPLEGFSFDAVGRRVDTLRQTLTMLPK